MKSGILNMYKPTDMTSFSMVAVVRGITREKAGHLGTLDPMAEGVLPVGIGGASRVMDYLDADIKEYRGTARIGLKTDTQDIWGTVIEDSPDASVSFDRLKDAAEALTGVISQVPPAYSAVKIDGKRLYAYARDGKVHEIKSKIKSRKVFIEKLEIPELNGRDFSFVVRCTKGTYIRTICHDIGEILGCGAAMTSLVRTKSGIFTADSGMTPDMMRSMDRAQIEKRVVSTGDALVNLGKAALGAREEQMFRNGVTLRAYQWKALETPRYAEEEFPLPLREIFRKGYKVYGPCERFIGVGFAPGDGSLRPDKVFD